jgi:copper transport protein
MFGRVALRSTCGALVVAVALLLASAGSASAHAAFLSSDPTDGEIFDTAPAVISLHFSEKVLLESSHVDLIELGKGVTDHLVLAGSDGAQSVTATLPALTRGAYVVRFTVVDPADLHRTVGSIAFGVGVAPPASAAGGQLDASWWSVAMSAIGFGGVAVLVGAAVLLVAAADSVRRQREQLLSLVSRCSAVVAAAWTVSFVVEGAAVGWGRVAWLRLLVASDPGRRALLGVLLAAGTWWLVTLVRSAVSASVDRLVAAMAAVVVVVGSYGGHSSIGGNQWAGFALRMVHFGAIAVWVGSVAVAWWCVR